MKVDLLKLKRDIVAETVDNFLKTGLLPQKWDDITETTAHEFDLDLVVQVCREAVRRRRERIDQIGPTAANNEMDSWLAARLHYAFRAPRRIAADELVWAWLALQCHEYVDERFPPGSKNRFWRFYDKLWTRNGLSRLWWGAEMCRVGEDYSAVPVLFRRVRTAQFSLELYYSHYRPAAVAFAMVAEGEDGGALLSDTQLRALSVKINLLLSLRGLELAHVGRVEESEEFDADWASHVPPLVDVIGPDLTGMLGPRAGGVESEAVEELVAWMREIADDIASSDEEQEAA